MCGHKQISIWEVSKITVVDSNVVNHWLMTCGINIPTVLISQCSDIHEYMTTDLQVLNLLRYMSISLLTCKF